ncbi:MAG: LptF/LptG family permease [Phycisphaeraceae bacterium]
MKTIDRYIVRQFLINFAILLAVVMTLFVVMDFILNQDEFLEAGRVRAEEHGGVLLATLFSIVDYYAPLLILAFVFFAGLLVTGAMGFTLVSLERNRELVALTAAGISLYRAAAPILVAGIAIIALILPIQELVIPPLAGKIARGPAQVKHRTFKSFPITFARDNRGNLLTAGRFDPEQQTLEDVSVLLRNERGLARGKILADTAVWDEIASHWHFPTSGYRVDIRDQSEMDSEPLEPVPVAAYATELSPVVLTVRRATLYSRLLSMDWLQRMRTSDVLSPAQQSDVTRILWSRFSLVVIHALVLTMSLPFFLAMRPGSVLMQGVKASAVALTAWGGSLVILQVSPGGLNPVTAAWLPVIILMPISIGLLQLVRS